MPVRHDGSARPGSHTFAPLSNLLSVDSLYRARDTAIPSSLCRARGLWPRLQVQKVDVKGRRGSATASHGVHKLPGASSPSSRARVAVLTRPVWRRPARSDASGHPPPSHKKSRKSVCDKVCLMTWRSRGRPPTAATFTTGTTPSPPSARPRWYASWHYHQ